MNFGRSRLTVVTLLILAAIGASLVTRRLSLSGGQDKPCGPQPCGAGTELTEHEIDFPYYSLRDGFKSTLLVVDDWAGQLEFQVFLHSLSGRTLQGPSITIEPQQKLNIDVGGILANERLDLAEDFAEGSISIKYRAASPMPLLGQITIQDPERHLVYESRMVQNNPGMSDVPSVLNSVWWGLAGGRDATITVSNTGDRPTTADVFLDFHGTRHAVDPLKFRPRETRPLSITQLLSNLGMSPAQVVRVDVRVLAATNRSARGRS